MRRINFVIHQRYYTFLLLLLALIGFIFLFDPSGAKVYGFYRAVLIGQANVNTWIKLFTSTLGIIGLLAGLLAHNKWVRCVTWSVFVLMTFINGASDFLLNEEFNIHHYETIVLEARGFGEDFLHSVQSNLVGFALKFFGVLLVTGYLFLMLRQYSFIPSLWLLLFGIIACGVTVVRSKGVDLVGPSAFTMPEMILYKHTLSAYSGPRDDVAMVPVKNSDAEVIILVIDESIRGDYLSINNQQMNTTPHLEKMDLINFGIATSAGNCSRQSNIMIRVGLTPKDIPDKGDQAMRRPSIFNYAVKAGFKTAYGTNQIKTGYQNYMNKYEENSINTYQILGNDSKDVPCGDFEVIKFIKSTLESGEKVFIMVNKNGAHFPYAERFQSQNAAFHPYHERGERHSDPVKIINAYKNAVHWTVDEFFKNVMPLLENKKYVLIYTSDHGEHVEAAKNGIGHGSTFSLPKEEAMVPLLVSTNIESLSTRMKQAQQVKVNKATHFDIFPALLDIMGYDTTLVREAFGPSLCEGECHDQKTYTGSIFYYGKWHTHSSFNR